MPKITISEKDLTVNNAIDVTETIVFVPGMTTKAVATAPKLYRTTDEFVKDFGSTPYKFVNTQTDGATVTYLAAGEYERSYIYALELLNIGLPVYFYNVVQINTSNDGSSVHNFYNKLTATENNAFQPVIDRWLYNVKFITSGGYATILDTTKSGSYGILQTMLMAAAVRADAIALADVSYNEDILTTSTNINENIAPKDPGYKIGPTTSDICNLKFAANDKRKEEETTKYGAIVGPGGVYQVVEAHLTANNINENNQIKMAGSFGYLLALANSIKIQKNPDYFAIAGVTRGFVPHLKSLTVEPTGADIEVAETKEKEKISINPIVKVQPNFGYCIWGNRTLFPNPLVDLAASSFLNIRVMSADVKKVIYNACKKFTFETNSTELWLNFKSEVEPLLEKMVANGALEDFELLKQKSTERATLSVYVKLVTQYAVEDFDITIGLTDSTVEEAL